MGLVFDSSSETAVNQSNMTIVQNRLRTRGEFAIDYLQDLALSI
jgi:hypothetical protein